MCKRRCPKCRTPQGEFKAKSSDSHQPSVSPANCCRSHAATPQ
uniref:Uncharacterized protein n=1 Tax=Anguilla anguilla TaxID=7936 RepID=A0A0E9VN56_ANGAN